MSSAEELDLSIALAATPILAPRGGCPLLVGDKPPYPHFYMKFSARNYTPGEGASINEGSSRLCISSQGVIVFHHLESNNGPIKHFSYLELTNPTPRWKDFLARDPGTYVCRLAKSKEVSGKKLKREVWSSYSIVNIGTGEPESCDIKLATLGGTPPCVQHFCGTLRLHDIWEEEES